MKEAREAHLLTVNIKNSVAYDMAQATSTAAKVGSISVTLNKFLTPGAGGRIDSMHHALKMGYQNIGVLQHNLTGLCNVVGTLDQKIHYLSQNDTAQSTNASSTISPRDDLEVRILTLTAELDGVRQIT